MEDENDTKKAGIDHSKLLATNYSYQGLLMKKVELAMMLFLKVNEDRDIFTD